MSKVLAQLPQEISRPMFMTTTREVGHGSSLGVGVLERSRRMLPSGPWTTTLGRETPSRAVKVAVVPGGTAFSWLFSMNLFQIVY